MTYYKKQGIPCNNCKGTGLAVRKEGSRRVRHQCPVCMGERVVSSEPKPAPEDAAIEDLSLLIKRLAYALKRANPSHPLPIEVHQFMTERGYWSTSNIMRGADDGQ